MGKKRRIPPFGYVLYLYIHTYMIQAVINFIKRQTTCKCKYIYSSFILGRNFWNGGRLCGGKIIVNLLYPPLPPSYYESKADLSIFHLELGIIVDFMIMGMGDNFSYMTQAYRNLDHIIKPFFDELLCQKNEHKFYV